jgi:hypothetical protein
LCFGYLAFFLSAGYAAESLYSGGAHSEISKGVYGPLTLGDRAKYGTVQLRANQEFTYDDNLWLSQDNTTNDWAYIASPGISYRLGEFKNNALEVGYDVNVIRYFDRTDEDGEEHYPYLRALFTLGKTKLTITDNLTFVQGGQNRVGGNESTSRVLKTENDATIATETEISEKFAIGFRLHPYFYSPQGALLQRTQIDGGAAVYYKAFAKADLFLEGVGGHVDVKRGSREDFAQGKLGVRGELTPKLTGKADVGFEHRTSSVPGISSQTVPILGCGLTHQFTDDVSVSTRSTRAINNSIATSGQTYVSSVAGIKLDYQFGPMLQADDKTRKLKFSLDFSYENDDFDQPSASGIRQNLHLYTVSPSIEFRIQPYWKLYFVYRYQDNDSNLIGGDYQNNRISMGSLLIF